MTFVCLKEQIQLLRGNMYSLEQKMYFITIEEKANYKLKEREKTIFFYIQPFISDLKPSALLLHVLHELLHVFLLLISSLNQE